MSTALAVGSAVAFATYFVVTTAVEYKRLLDTDDDDDSMLVEMDDVDDENPSLLGSMCAESDSGSPKSVTFAHRRSVEPDLVAHRFNGH